MVQIKQLTKTFENSGTVALNKLNLSVSKGSIYGLVGANGCGKTTVIKHLAGVYKADEGEVLIDGQNIYDNPLKKALIAYVPDDLYFFPQYNLKMLGKFYKNMYPSWSDERFKKLISLLNLNPKGYLNRFSKGMKKQAIMVIALSIKPQLLLLDEPTDGLDPLVRKKLFQWIIEDVADRNMTVLFSGHNLKEMDGLCDTIGFLKNGEMIMEKDLDELKSQLSSQIEHEQPTLDELFEHIYETKGEGAND